MIKKYNKELALLALFIVIFIVMAGLSPGKFISAGNVRTMMLQMPEFAFFSLAMMIIFITGGVNLSIVTTSALSGIVLVTVMSGLSDGGMGPTASILLALLAALCIALICGMLNAFFVAGLGVAPLLATLGTSSLFEGICLSITKGHALSGMPNAYYKLSKVSFLQIPLLMWILIITILAVYILMELTPWGKKVYMAGCNPVATEYSGINIRKVVIKAYLFSAIMSFLAMMAMTIRYNYMRSDYGSSYLMQSITACVLGGVAVNGGYGRVFGVVLAVGTLQVLSSGLNIFEANAFLINIVMGFILLLVLSVSTIMTYIKEKKVVG